jgi:hypothetical protein
MSLTDSTTDTDRQPACLPHTPTVTETDMDGRWQWLPPRDAQQQLGISERTLFRRIARGQLQRRHRADGQVEVCVPITRPSTPDAETVSDRQEADIERGLVLVDRFGQALAQQVTPLLQELTDTRRQLVTLAQENGRLQAERDQLAARVAALEQLGAHAPIARMSATPDPQQSWWTRLLWWRA